MWWEWLLEEVVELDESCGKSGTVCRLMSRRLQSGEMRLLHSVWRSILTAERKSFGLFSMWGGGGGLGDSLQVFVGFAAASSYSPGSSEGWGCTQVSNKVNWQVYGGKKRIERCALKWTNKKKKLWRKGTNFSCGKTGNDLIKKKKLIWHLIKNLTCTDI